MARLYLLTTLLATALFASDDLDERGWHRGTPAARTAAALTPQAPVPLTLPEAFAQRIQRRTFVLYFSPTCGHCVAAAPEIARLSADKSLGIDFLGVATAASSQEQIDAFSAELHLDFPMVIDEEREFARATGAKATPVVLVMEPDGAGGIQVVDAYTPWFSGASAILRVRADLSHPFAGFAPGVYQGGVACAHCHAEEAKSWILSHHAIAYLTLYERDRAEDLECVGCHVTGMGAPGGFVVGDHRSPMAGVTCEACHSAGGPHDGAPAEPAAACVGCHDAEHSVAFSYEKGLPHLDHFLGNTLSDAEVEARWQALTSGELERPLLAMPEGPHVGAAVCKDCHAEEAKSWKRSPHADAMSSLEGAEAQVECVRCHASPLQSGPEPTELSGFRTEDGVSCEDCHGPGGAHAAEPRRDNIVGLGESCPECVIEAICTSCHTRKWDPTWDLDKRLQAARH